MAQAESILHAPLPLIVSPFDPSGAGNLPADAVICARMGTHALSVVTAVHVQDSAGLTSLQRIAAELIDEQARCLLEDMAVGAIKVGPLYDPETVSILTQIVTDYSELPLVLHLAMPPDAPDLDDLDAEDTIGALLELLVPQARIIVCDRGMLEQWAAQGLLSASRADDPVSALHDFGVPSVLCCHVASQAGGSSLILHQADEAPVQWRMPGTPVRVADTESLLATLATTLLAKGLSAPEAARQAAQQAIGMVGRNFHPGMGQRMILHTLP